MKSKNSKILAVDKQVRPTDVAIINGLESIEDKVDEVVAGVNSRIDAIKLPDPVVTEKVVVVEKETDNTAKLEEILEEVKKKEEVTDIQVSDEVLAKIKGEPGKDYILTDEDKKEIAKKVKVPVVTNTETVREIPVVKEVAVTDSAQQIAEKINTLEKQIDFKVLKNVPEFTGKGGTKLISARSGGGVSKIIAGTNIAVSPADGKGDVTVSVTGSLGAQTFLDLTDTPSTYVGQALKATRVNAGETAIEFYTTVDTDEKTKVSANDTTAGYLNGKLVAGTGITLTENNNGGNETLTITNSQDLSGYVPYTGATGDVNIGEHALIADIFRANGSAGLSLENSNSDIVGYIGVANTQNVLWYGSHNFDNQTQDTIAAFQGSGKTLSSLATSTYPSLTELSYVKGVTSAIQTQLNTKTSGSGTANQLTYWTGTSTISGDAAYTLDATNKILKLQATTSSTQANYRLRNTSTGNVLMSFGVNANDSATASSGYYLMGISGGFNDLSNEGIGDSTYDFVFRQYRTSTFEDVWRIPHGTGTFQHGATTVNSGSNAVNVNILDSEGTILNVYSPTNKSTGFGLGVGANDGGSAGSNWFVFGIDGGSPKTILGSGGYGLNGGTYDITAQTYISGFQKIWRVPKGTNEMMFGNTATNLGGQVGIIADTSTTKGLIQRDAASASVVTWEHQNSAGTVINSISYDGTFLTNSNVAGGTAKLRLTGEGSPSGKYIFSTNGVYSGSGVNYTTDNSAEAYWQFAIDPRSGADQFTVGRGPAGVTSSLVNFLTIDSAAVLTNVGNIITKNTTGNTGNQLIAWNNTSSNTARARLANVGPGQANFTANGIYSGSGSSYTHDDATLPFWETTMDPRAGSDFFRVMRGAAGSSSTPTSFFTIIGTNRSSFGDTSLADGVLNVRNASGQTAVPTLVLRSVTSQTADRLQLLSTGGAKIIWADSNGTFNISDTVTSNPYTSMMFVEAAGATYSAATFRARTDAASAPIIETRNQTGNIVFQTDVYGGAIFNEIGSANGDVRMEGDTDVNNFFSDASTDRIGIGMNNPAYKLDVTGDINASGVYRSGGTAGVSGTFATVDLKTVTVTNGIITSIV